MRFSRIMICLGGFFVCAMLAQAGTALQWYLRESGVAKTLTGVAYGQGRYVAVGGSNHVLLSSDGMAWTAKTPFVSGDDLRGVAAGNNCFVLVSRTQAWRSDDGSNWTPAANPAAAIFHRVRFINGDFYAVGNYAAVFRSRDGLQWNVLLDNQHSNFCYDITAGAGMLVAVGEKQDGKIFVTRSFNNGASWIEAPQTIANTLRSVAYGNGRFVAVGGEAYPNPLMITSTNGADWTVVGNVGEDLFQRVIFEDGVFVACAGGGTVLMSADGLRWTRQWPEESPVTGSSINDLCYAEGRFLGVGYRGTIVQSAPLRVGPAVMANGVRASIVLESQEKLTLSVAMYAGEYAGRINVDWWIIAYAHAAGAWFCYTPDGWQPFSGWSACRPAYRGVLVDLDDTVLLRNIKMPAGNYTFYFAISAPSDGVFAPDNPAKTMMADAVNVRVRN